MSHQKKTNAAEAQNLLHDELNEFRNDFKPKVFLQKFLQKNLPPHEIFKLLKFAHSQSSAAERTAAYEKILAVAKSRLEEERLPFRPLFLGVSDAELEDCFTSLSDKFKRTFNHDLHNPGPDLETFYGRFISSFSFYTYGDSQLSQLQTDINRYYMNKYSLRKEFQKKNFFRGILSFFPKKNPIYRRVSLYFSDIYDFSNLLFYCQVENNGKECIGGINVGYLQTELQPEKIADSVLNLSQKKNMRRFVSPNPAKIILQKNQRMIFEPFPGGKNGWFIGAVLQLEQNENLQLLVESYCFWRKLLLLLFLLLLVRIRLFDLNLPVRLRFKLLIILAFAVVFPTMAGVALLSGISGNHAEIERKLGADYLESRLNLYELDYEEIMNRQVLHNLHFKLNFGKELEKKSLTDIDFKKFHAISNLSIRNSNIYQANGSKISLMGKRIRGRGLDRILGSYSVASLKNLGSLEENEVTKKDLQLLGFTLGLAGDVADAFDFSRIAGNEGEHTIRMSGFNTLNRSNFYLFSSAEDKDHKVKAIGFFDLHTILAFSKHFESRPDYSHRCFSLNYGPYKGELAIALRDTSEIVEEYWAYPTFKRSEEIQNLFRLGINSRESGRINDNVDTYKSFAWRFNETVPFIFAGFVEFDRKRFSAFFFWLILILFPFLVFISLTLVSQLMSRLFLAPIETLSKAVNQITVSGDSDVSVEIGSNDEFSLVEKAFNQMTHGLMQKKHISRFVSQRLVNAIEQDFSTISRQSVDFAEMTILSSDARDFTTISESQTPEIVVEILNEYFTKMEEAIKKEGGIIDRFIGDAIIAVFQPEHLGLPAVGAIRAASRMRHKLQKLNQVFQSRFNLKIDNGIGIASGKALIANLGRSCERRDSTIVGEIVDRAELLEAKTKSGRFTRIIVDENTYRNLSDSFMLQKMPDEAICCYELEKLVIYEED